MKKNSLLKSDENVDEEKARIQIVEIILQSFVILLSISIEFVFKTD